MATYKTPGVYTEEVSLLPPSVAEVSTAIPAFVGYTEKAGKEDELLNKPTRISTLLEYEELFGGPKPVTFTVETDPQNTITNITKGELKHILYYNMQMYFKNGGGPCYIVSVGNYSNQIEKGDDTSGILGGLKALLKEDEPTLLVFTEATQLAEGDYYEVCQAALAQCAKLKDRFTILDVLDGDDDASGFRLGIGTNDLKYGAAYYPYLQTSLNYHYEESEVTVGDEDLAAMKVTQTALYNQIKTELNKQRLILPPSSAVAGIYARVDRERGVWKAPANVSLTGVIGPAIEITNEDQDNLNIDVTAGKSINAIRSFIGQGTLIWGARTLAGNDNEWRYISVRRLFNMIEESTQKATAFAVFEANNETTWLKVRAMIDNFLYDLWEQGALAGQTTEAAYFVNIGLGETMTQQDILEGKMIVEIGIAAVRPAEFIILRFSHKLQEA